MDRIIKLLKEKNHFLERFFEANDNELLNFGERNFNGLEDFYSNRESILEMIGDIDSLISDENKKLKEEVQPTPEQKREIELALHEKERWIKSILAQDLHILSCVEKEKSNIISELRRTSRAKKVVGAYHSGNQVNQLDEEV